MQVEIDKPLGLRLKASNAKGGGCVVAVCNSFSLLHPTVALGCCLLL
jgi:hypothetical protein